MRPETRARLNNPALLEAVETGFARLEALFVGQIDRRVFFLNGRMRYSEDDGPEWEQWLDHSLDELADEIQFVLDPLVFRPLIINYNPHGVHFVDALLGADVFQMPDGSWQARPIDTPVGSLQAPDLFRLPGWQVMQDFTRAFLERDVRGVIFALPTIASALNVALTVWAGDPGGAVRAARSSPPRPAGDQ